MVSSIHVVSAGNFGSGTDNGIAMAGNNGGGIGVGPGDNGRGVTVQQCKCVLQRIEPLMINEADDNEV